MSKASLEILSQLHDAIAKKLLEKIRSGEATAQDYNAAIRFLSDNGINVDAKPGDPTETLGQAAKEFEESLNREH